MKTVKLLAILCLCAIAQFTQAQNIFSYGGTQVTKEEFLRMYTKNNMSKKADMSEKALREYVTLYSRFKMKVAEAEKMKLDTIGSIVSELTNYKKQLSKSFLTDKDVINNLTKETHDRLKKEIEVAHIMITMPRGNERDSMNYYRRADSIYNLLITKKGNWDTLAKYLSEDKSNNTKGGLVGYITALQTPYAFETGAYNTPIGTYSKPVRTQFGYHIIKRIAERPSQGEVQVAQILIIVKKGDDAGKIIAKAKADSIYAVCKQGKISFDTLVKAFSQDKFSINNNGELTPFGVGAMALPFEKAAFGLKNADDISMPVETDYGYHIIKLIKKMPLKTYDEMKNELAKKIERDGRVDAAKQAFIGKLKTKYKFQEMPLALNSMINAIPDSNVRNGNVIVNTSNKGDDKLFSIDGKSFTQTDLYEYIATANRGRLSGTKDAAMRNIYKSYVDKTMLEYEENNLANENVEFKNLIKEYRDGIILFDLTDKSVWTKASTDSIGLADYFAKNTGKYQWNPCFEGNVIKFNNEANAKQFLADIKNGTAEEKAIENINATSGATANSEKGKFEYDKMDKSIIAVKENTYSAPFKNADNTFSIAHPVTVFLNKSNKTLNEARGYAIADYQDFLEKQWIASMENKYPVQVNEAVLKSMVK
jgi:peptidyl-prolyl cis-trans isomerase SurA